MQHGRKRIFVAGDRGMVGSAIMRNLSFSSDAELVVRDRTQLDLLDQAAVATFFANNQIDEVYLAAAKVGGIVANQKYPADFISENLAIQTNIISAAHTNNVNKLLFIASSAIYPKLAAQPISEHALLTGPLDQSHEPYALAKLAGLTMCASLRRQYGRDYRCVVPTNLYGPGDNFHRTNSHVIPGLIRRFWEATQNSTDTINIWGTGTPRREFMHVDDMADACVYIMRLDETEFYSAVDDHRMHVNVGVGTDYQIREVAALLAEISGYLGQLVFDSSKPDGAPRKLMDSNRLKRLGWHPTIPLDTGLKQLYEWFVEHHASSRK